MLLIKKDKVDDNDNVEFNVEKAALQFCFLDDFSTKGCESLARSYQQTVNIIRKWLLAGTRL